MCRCCWCCYPCDMRCGKAASQSLSRDVKSLGTPNRNLAGPQPRATHSKNRKSLFQLRARVSLAWPTVNDPSGGRSASPSLSARRRHSSFHSVSCFSFICLSFERRAFSEIAARGSLSLLSLILFCLILWDREFGCLHLFLFLSILRRRSSVRRGGDCQRRHNTR